MAQRMLWKCDGCGRQEETDIQANPPSELHLVELYVDYRQLPAKKFIWCVGCLAFVLGTEHGPLTALRPALS